MVFQRTRVPEMVMVSVAQATADLSPVPQHLARPKVWYQSMRYKNFEYTVRHTLPSMGEHREASSLFRPAQVQTPSTELPSTTSATTSLMRMTGSIIIIQRRRRHFVRTILAGQWGARSGYPDCIPGKITLSSLCRMRDYGSRNHKPPRSSMFLIRSCAGKLRLDCQPFSMPFLYKTSS